MDERSFDRRGLIQAGAAAAAGVVVGGVVSAAPATAAVDPNAIRSGNVLFAPLETSKTVAVPGGLTATSRAWASLQKPLPTTVMGVVFITVTRPDPATGTLTIKIEDPSGGARWWNWNIAWFVHG
jgi:hypothetical protein